MVARRRSNGSVVLADLDSGVRLATVPSDSGSLTLKSGMAFTPDGTQLITVTEAAQTGDALLSGGTSLTKPWFGPRAQLPGAT